MNTQERKPDIGLYIKWMIRRDMAEVLEIESLCFQFPWSEDDFIRFLRQRNVIGMTAEREDRVDGYIVYGLEKTRLEVLNFAVRPRYHREGIGRAMVDELKGKLSSQKRTSIIVTVRETNLEAQLFFRAQEFRHAQTLRSYYDDTDEDAYLLKYRLAEAAHV